MILKKRTIFTLDKSRLPEFGTAQLQIIILLLFYSTFSNVMSHNNTQVFITNLGMTLQHL